LAAKSLLWRRLAELGARTSRCRGALAAITRPATPRHSLNPWGPDDGSALVFPDLPVYIMIPTITAVVIDGGADLKPLAVTINGDVDSWCWSFEMQIPAETFALVNPGTGRPDADPRHGQRLPVVIRGRRLHRQPQVRRARLHDPRPQLVGRCSPTHRHARCCRPTITTPRSSRSTKSIRPAGRCYGMPWTGSCPAARSATTT
jgi:hypothetical protein